MEPFNIVIWLGFEPSFMQLDFFHTKQFQVEQGDLDLRAVSGTGTEDLEDRIGQVVEEGVVTIDFRFCALRHVSIPYGVIWR